MIRQARRAPPLLLAILAACGGSTATGPARYAVTYAITVTGSVSVDSVHYDDGTGTMVTLIRPATGVLKSLQPSAPVSIGAVAWTHIDPLSSVKLKATWMVVGQNGFADSSMATAGASGTAAALVIVHHSM